MIKKDLSLLQIAVLCALRQHRPTSGKQLREKIAPIHNSSLPAFYQLMSRLQSFGLVKSYRFKPSNTAPTERFFYLSESGMITADHHIDLILSLAGRVNLHG